MAWEAGSREMRQFPVPTSFSGSCTVRSQDLQILAIMKPPHCEETKLHSEPRGRLRTIFNQIWKHTGMNLLCGLQLFEISWLSTFRSS